MALPDPGVISYNGFRFPSNTQTTAISVVPQYDEARRTVIYSRIRISLRCVLTGSGIDAIVRAAVQLLNRPAYSFVYSGRGYGLVVNVGSVRDVVWGPKPSEATVRPLGGGNAVELTWSIEVGIPDGAARYTFAPLEYNWSATYEEDAAGYTTRTIQGFLRIPLTRNGANDRALADNIDSYREDVYPPPLEDFRRGERSWVISPAKDRADFSVVDRQFGPNKPPVGIVDCAADHVVASVPGQLVMWTGVINGTFELARNGSATMAEARNAFFAIAKDRIGQTIETISKNQSSELRTAGSGAGETTAVVLPVAFTMSEPEIFGRPKVRYSLTYAVRGASLRTMLQGSGLFRPVGPGWSLWAQSMGPVLGARGHAGLVFDVHDDRIVDLFQPGSLLTSLGGRVAQVASDLTSIPRDVFPEPTPDGSWISYNQTVRIETDSGVAEVRTLPTEQRTADGDLYTPGATAGGGLASTALGSALGAIPGAFPGVFANTDFFFPPPRSAAEQKKGGMDKPQLPQRRARQAGWLYLIGSAVRVRYAIPAPEAKKWGDATLTLANRKDRGEGFWTSVVGNALWPIVAARWVLRYSMSVVPAETAPALPNPTLGGGGEAAVDLGRAIGDVLAGSKLWGR